VVHRVGTPIPHSAPNRDETALASMQSPLLQQSSIQHPHALHVTARTPCEDSRRPCVQRVVHARSHFSEFIILHANQLSHGARSCKPSSWWPTTSWTTPSRGGGSRAGTGNPRCIQMHVAVYPCQGEMCEPSYRGLSRSAGTCISAHILAIWGASGTKPLLVRGSAAPTIARFCSLISL